jgi:hypothetical protein
MVRADKVSDDENGEIEGGMQWGHEFLRKELEATIFQRDLVFLIVQRAATMARWALVVLLACQARHSTARQRRRQGKGGGKGEKSEKGVCEGM